MNSKPKMEQKKYHKFIILGGTVIVPLLLVSLLLVWTAHASYEIHTNAGSSTQIDVYSQETFNLEFYYTGDNPINASIAAIAFASLLSQESGLDIQASIHSCEASIVEHLGAGDADLAPLSAIAYVHGHEAYDMEARLVTGRFGLEYFRSQINVPAAAGFTDIWDLQNTRFVMPVPSSTSGYMVPYLMISETTGMTPTTFFSEVEFVGSHDQVIRDVYHGTADCGASYDDARVTLAGELPDVFTVVDVLTYSENIPNSPWAFRSGLDETVVQTLSDGIIAVSGTPEGASALETLFGYVPSSIGVTQDTAYDIWRDLAATFGLRMADCYAVYMPVLLRNIGQ